MRTRWPIAGESGHAHLHKGIQLLVAHHPLKAWLDTLAHDSSLREPNRLRERVEVLDRLEALLIHADEDDVATLHQAEALRTELETVDRALFRSLRSHIRQGHGTDIVRRWIAASMADDAVGDRRDGDNYDYCDVWLSGVLQFEEPAPNVAALPAEMVFYQPTPARHIFELIDRLALQESDVLMDLGAGLGHVPLLVAVCTSARCIGIELEQAYVDCAVQCASALNVANASFIRQDVRDADLSQGTVFYLYTPFVGGVMRTVLDALKQQAQQREIRVCTFGPCTALLAKETWLTAVGGTAPDRISMFHSV